MTVFNCIASLPRCSLLYLIVSTSPWKTPHSPAICPANFTTYFTTNPRLLIHSTFHSLILIAQMVHLDCFQSHGLPLILSGSSPARPLQSCICWYMFIQLWQWWWREEKRPPHRTEGSSDQMSPTIITTSLIIRPMGVPHSISPSFPSGN